MQAVQDMLKPTTEIDIPFVPKSVEQLILWRDVKKSGMLFGACTAISLFFFITKMSIATFLCYTFGFALIVCTAWARLGPAINKPMPELPSILREGMSEVDYKTCCDRLKPDIDNLTGVLNGLVKCKDLALNGKLIGVALVAGKVFSYIPAGVLSYLVVLVTFTVPKLYEMNKEKVDDALVTAQGKLNEGLSMAKNEAGKMMEKAPPGLKRVVDQFSAKKAA